MEQQTRFDYKVAKGETVAVRAEAFGVINTAGFTLGKEKDNNQEGKKSWEFTVPQGATGTIYSIAWCTFPPGGADVYIQFYLTGSIGNKNEHEGPDLRREFPDSEIRFHVG